VDRHVLLALHGKHCRQSGSECYGWIRTHDLPEAEAITTVLCLHAPALYRIDKAKSLVTAGTVKYYTTRTLY
jgi:hypothetical protein